jgi:vacuolar-type H+-ATPase subunit H
MAVSTIDRVREAEQKANEKQSAAELEAEQIIADAKNRAQQIIEDAKKKADDFDHKAAVESQSRADEIIRDRKAKAEADAQALSDKTLKQKQNVINKLIQETLS